MAEYAKSRLPHDTFGYGQIVALEMLEDASLDWREKYLKAKTLKANWAITKVLNALPLKDLDAACAFIEMQPIYKSSKRDQLHILASRVKAAKKLIPL